MGMIDFTPAHDTFRERLQEYLKVSVEPYSALWEEQGIVPLDAWKGMGEMGFLCTWVPEAYGGLGLDFLYSVIIMEEFARIGESGFMVSLHSDVVVPYLFSYGSEEVRKRYLPGCVSGETVAAVAMTEPDAGSDLASMTTTVEEDGGDFVINGGKTFISNGLNGRVVVVAARDPKVENPYEAISLFVVEEGTPGFEKGNKLQKMGLHSQDTAELFFSDCRIPRENLLGRRGNGFMMLMEKLQQERLVCAVSALAAGESVLDHVIARSREMVYSSGMPLIKAQDVRFSLVEMAGRLKMARAFVDNLVMQHRGGASIVVETSMAKFLTTDLLIEVTDKSMDLLGEYGLASDSFLAKAMRDGRVMTIFAGTNEIMKEICSRFMGF